MSEPIFLQIKSFITQQIAQKVYLPGDKIPTEEAIAVMFSTSRQTANKALRDLALEKVVVRFARRGTFVCSPQVKLSTLSFKNIADEISNRGNVYSNILLSLQATKASAVVASALGMVKDEPVFVSTLIHQENGIPVRLDIRYIKPATVPYYLEQDFKNITPDAYLRQICPAQKVINHIEAITADAMLQKHLDIALNEPILLVLRVVLSQGIKATFSQLFYPSSRYKLSLEQHFQ